MYYKTPIYGRAFRPFSTIMVEVTSANRDQWKFKKTVRWQRREYALFINSQGEEIMQSLQAIRFIRLRPGEDNYMAKLTNAQGIEVYKRAVNGEDRATIAQEFGISKHTVSDIKNLRARTSVTLNYLNGTPEAKQSEAVVAQRKKGKKLSESLAKFIRSDKVTQKLTTKQLAKKYCVSDRTIQRILRGDMYKPV